MRIESLAAQVAHGMYAREALRDAANMMTLFAQWDTLHAPEKAREYDKGTQSRFFFVPGFQPRYCGACNAETHFDYRDDPEGACGDCGAWDGRIAA